MKFYEMYLKVKTLSFMRCSVALFFLWFVSCERREETINTKSAGELARGFGDQEERDEEFVDDESYGESDESLLLDEETKQILIDFCQNKEVHTTLNVTFEELLVHVWNRIESLENKEFLK